MVLLQRAAIAKNEPPRAHATNVNTPLNIFCIEKLLLLYERLTEELLLIRCPRCLTQNANESLHSVIQSMWRGFSLMSRFRIKQCISSIFSLNKKVLGILSMFSVQFYVNFLTVFTFSHYQSLLKNRSMCNILFISN